MKQPTNQVFGEVLRTSVVTDLVLSETEYAPSVALPKHSHESAYFCLVLCGAFTEAYGNRSRLCEASTLVFHPANEIHSDRFHDAGGRCFNVQIDSRLIQRVREHSVVLDSSTHFHGGLLASLGLRLYREFRQPDEVSPLEIEGLVLEIIAEAARRSAYGSKRTGPRWLDDTREIIHARFSERLTLANIAGSVGVHPVHLAREFRKRYGSTLGEYTRRLRVEFACHQLIKSTASLSEIALAAGFSHQSHFSRTFKGLTGMTPAEYRMFARPR